jgi:hypothetical protein
LGQIAEAGLGYDQVRGSLGMAGPGLRRCLDAEGSEIPSSALMNFKVDASGKIVAASIKLEEKAPVDSACIMKALRHVRLTRAEGSGLAKIKSFPIRL